MCLKLCADKNAAIPAAGASTNLSILWPTKSGLRGIGPNRCVIFKLLDHIRIYGLLCQALDEVREILEGLNNDENSNVYDAVCKCLMLKLSDNQQRKVLNNDNSTIQ